MQEAKRKQLLNIARQFDQVYDSIQESLGADVVFLEQHGGIGELEERSRGLEQLQELYKTTSQFPVWPFNMENVTRFVTAYVSPIVIPLVAEAALMLMNR
jgi:hypothetical protein